MLLNESDCFCSSDSSVCCGSYERADRLGAVVAGGIDAGNIGDAVLAG